MEHWDKKTNLSFHAHYLNIVEHECQSKFEITSKYDMLMSYYACYDIVNQFTRSGSMSEKIRCAWVEDIPIFIDYHDNEWGRPVYDDRKLFEMLILEGAQAGLSWITVLKKREAYRKAFDGFDPNKVALYDEVKFQELMSNEGIIRNRLKIKSAITNAKLFLEVAEEHGSFAKFIWNYVDNTPIINQPEKLEDIPATTPLSDKISKDLKKMGFKFVGSTIIYAFMQATGMVNDHIVDCPIKNACINPINLDDC